MFKATTNIKTLSVACEAFTAYPLYNQSVRWGRKPIWMPTAKSKLFRVPPRIRLPKDEEEELKRLHNNYRTQLKSLHAYFEETYSDKNKEDFDVEQHTKAIQEDFVRCSKINDEWNASVRRSREEREVKELQESIEDAKRRIQERAKINAERLEQAEGVVRKEKEAAKYFITPDKLDAAIEYAINNPVDYNFALDLEGNKIRGRETKPPQKPADAEKVSVSAIQ